MTRDDVNTPKVALVGFVSALIVFLIILLTEVFYFNFHNQLFDAKVISQPFAEFDSVKAEQLAQLNGYTVDKKNNTAKIPIDDAMKIIVRESISAPSVNSSTN
ncbi:MAG: hypothetical protein GC154_00780 [bacterium]|nr:hypothetical protein [bacterium]